MNDTQATIQWRITVPIFRNTIILEQLGIAVGIPFGLVALRLCVEEGELKLYRKKTAFLMAAILALSLLAACGGNGTDAPSGGLQDPYSAYGLVREKSYGEGKTLHEAMRESPPSVIVLEPVFYYRMYYEPVPQSGEITLEKGKSANLSLDLELVHTSGETAAVKSHITLKYDGKKDEDLFHADTGTYGNPMLYINGAYVNEYGSMTRVFSSGSHIRNTIPVCYLPFWPHVNVEDGGTAGPAGPVMA